MTILQSLNSYYDRLPDVAEPGWSAEKFGWCIVLDRNGEAVDVHDLRDLSGKKPQVKYYKVPAAVKRTAGIAPNFLWDKTAYVLGRTVDEGKRTAQEHAEFLALHAQRLAGQNDEGLTALRLFLEKWTPDKFDQAPFRLEMLDANVVFRLDGERWFIHERVAARALVAMAGERDEGGQDVFCLVSGARGIPVRLHPTIRGVEGAQKAGAALVSFNLDAFTSLGKKQGENAPTSETTAFRYGAALNHLLTRDGPNRLHHPVGDATVVFWADASDAHVAEAADKLAAQWMDADTAQEKDEVAAAEIRRQMEQIAAGKGVAELRADIKPGTRFHVLGLSPNAARLSVRFWLSSSFDEFARNLAQHYHDLAIEPLPPGWGAAPSVNKLLVKTTALRGEYKNIPPQLAGDMMRAVLLGTAYPLSLLSAVLTRLRAGDPKTSDGKSGNIGWHAAAIRAVLVRLARTNRQLAKPGVTPMSLQRDYDNPGYQLGRLFALYELAQRAALGGVNASIRDKYFGAASATPASVFPLIIRGGQNHLAKIRKEMPGWAVLIERELDGVYNQVSPQFPRSLNLQNQGEFAIGYYHQRNTKLANGKGDEVSTDSTTGSSKGDEE